MRRLIKILVFGLILSQWVQAQTTPESQYGVPLFSAEVGVVNVTVVALDRNNRPLQPFGKQNFKVEERRAGEKNFREVEFNLDLPERLSLRGGIIMDTSGSTAGQFLYQRDVASEIVKWIIRAVSNSGRGDKFFVAEFYYESLDQNPSQGLFTLKQDWTNNINDLVEAIVRRTKKAAGTSPLFGSVRLAAEKFRTEPGSFANFLIVISDGQNNMSFSGLKDSTYMAQAANLPIYTIGTASHDSNKVDPEFLKNFEQNLKQISQLTGGRFFDLPAQNKLPEIARQILQDLRNQYHLNYKLNPEYNDGDEIEIRVSVGNVGPNGQWRQLSARLLHRKGYRVTKKY